MGKEKGLPEEDLMKGNALIRSNLGINPATLDTDEWAERFCEAVWLENERLKNLAELLAAMWAKK